MIHVCGRFGQALSSGYGPFQTKFGRAQATEVSSRSPCATIATAAVKGKRPLGSKSVLSMDIGGVLELFDIRSERQAVINS